VTIIPDKDDCCDERGCSGIAVWRAFDGHGEHVFLCNAHLKRPYNYDRVAFARMPRYVLVHLLHEFVAAFADNGGDSDDIARWLELDPTELSYMIASNRDERLRIIHRDWLARAEAWFPIGSRVEVTAGYFVGDRVGVVVGYDLDGDRDGDGPPVVKVTLPLHSDGDCDWFRVEDLRHASEEAA